MELLKRLPKVDRLLEAPEIRSYLTEAPQVLIVEAIRETLEQLRTDIRNGKAGEADLAFETIVRSAAIQCAEAAARSLRRAVNGVGIVLHTGMGRAPLAESAQAALADAIVHYNTLQADRQTGGRGNRYIHVESLLCRLTGAEATLVVNNNAAATMLILNTLGEGQEVIVSRGELVEIGGAFRIPDVMRRSGARLCEVGATNRTHLKDYREAITAETGILLKVHQSNYRIIGFSKDVSIAELSVLAGEHGIYAVDDLGSGALIDLSRWGLPKEPMVQDSIAAGADAVCFSGDKLIGGPQCGIIVGKKEVIDKMKKNPLTRALRCGKLTFSALEATLRLFLDEKQLLVENPCIRMLTEQVDEIKKRCQRLRRRLLALESDRLQVDVIADRSEVGSGALAAVQLDTFVIAITVKGLSPDALARKLRMGDPIVFGRIKDERFLLDGRTLREDEFNLIRSALGRVLLEMH
ncbi:L-seryl-tRNA(Sec) selenium transferase [bacterium]|nr:L-seryl-tRNA(Sec) selenium transferase [bacterium]